MSQPLLSQKESKVTIVGAILNLILAAIKISAGTLGGSYALISDGFHSLSDLVSDGVVLCGIYFANLPPDENHTHGHGKIQTLLEIGMGVLLIFVAYEIGKEAAFSIFEQKQSNASFLTISVAVVSIFIKEGLFWYTYKIGKELDDSMLIANAWHHRSDSLSTIGVLIGLIVIYFKPEWGVVDSFIGFVIAVLILKVGFEVILDAMKRITDTVPDKSFLEDILKIANEVAEVEHPHDIGVRFLGNKIAIEIHIEVNPKMTVLQAHDISDLVAKKIRKYDSKITQVLVHVDPKGIEEDRRGLNLESLQK
ncbi:MAG: cation transporter [Calditrichaeota bacterium]|nr:MAG: cation transporter [Calditrichota bacterium]